MNHIEEIMLTPQGGNYIRAMLFHWFSVTVAIVPVAMLLLVAVVNPFWFRDSMFNWVERLVRRITRWRDYIKYRIYLGTDPKMWHALRGEKLGK